MPITGQVDVTDIIKSLGDNTHGLRAAGPAENTEEQEEEYIYQATWGETDISTSMGITKAWAMIWDVNGYYRNLGIYWPFTPTKAELRVAYIEHNGMESEYLTYILKQLMNHDIRAAYDARPLGRPLRDKYVLAEEMRMLSEQAAKESGDSGDVVTIGDIIADDQAMFGNRESIPELPPLNNTWEWGFFLLKSRKKEYEDLIQWQEMLIKAFHDVGIVKKISIGYIGKTRKNYVIREWYDRTIIFLNEKVIPTQGHAEAVASKFKPKNRKELQ